MNCIYQMWDGPMPQGEVAGAEEMRAYAGRIGADYIFDRDRKLFPKLVPAYGRFAVLHDQRFRDFGSVLYADTDVWPVEGLAQSLFEGFSGDLGVCTEPLQPQFRQAATSDICAAADEKWAACVAKTWGVQMPRDECGRLKVYNSGMQVWSPEGRKRAAERFVPFNDYIKVMRPLKLHGLYASDQPYLHAMMFFAKLDVVELDNDWNRFIHFRPDGISDQRTPATKFVHVQLRGAGHWAAEKLRRIVNRPQEEWGKL